LRFNARDRPIHYCTILGLHDTGNYVGSRRWARSEIDVTWYDVAMTGCEIESPCEAKYDTLACGQIAVMGSIPKACRIFDVNRDT